MDISVKKRIAIILGVILLVILWGNQYRFSPTGMVVQNLYNLDYTLDHLDEIKDIYNQNIDKVPNFAKTIFGNEKMDIQIQRRDETTARISIETKNAVIKQMTTSAFDSYTLKVKIDENTINSIINSKYQVARLKQAIDNKEIEYKALRFKTSMKIRLSKIFLSVFNWFG